MPDTKDAPHRCSFCGKSQGEVKRLIAGPSIFICDKCVGVCNEILADDARDGAGESAPGAAAAVPMPEGTRVGTINCPKCGGRFVVFTETPPGRTV